MKIEVTDSMSFDEYNERIYYEVLSDEKKEKSRRDFLKYLVIGSSGLLIPMYPAKDANAVAPVVFYLGVFVAGYVYGSKVFGSGDLPICKSKFANEENKEKELNINCRIKKDDKHNFSYDGNGVIIIPPKRIYTTEIKTEKLYDSGKYTAKVKERGNNTNHKADKFRIS